MKMKSLYLILAATAVAVTCEPQRSNNDIIWYPVDDEEGVFVSTFGEKYRTSPDAKWRSHRRARYSGMQPLPLSYDPSENYDPSFFHNINERRPSATISRIPPSFQPQQYPVKSPNKIPQGQGNINNFQEIINEVFDYNKYPPSNGYPGGVPGTTNQWTTRPGNQWEGNLVTENTNIWGQTTGNQWGGTSGPGQRPGPTNQWTSSTGQRPTDTEWVVTQSNRPNRRPTDQSDKLIFPGEASNPTTTPSNLIPMDPPTMSPCERLCPVTPEFNPVCGSDAVTYSNAGRLKCAQMCGKNVRLSHYGNCGRTTLVTPLVSSSPKQRGFW